MTRRLAIQAEFEYGTVVETTPDPAYDSEGMSHAYYVPEEARKHAARAAVDRDDPPEAYVTESGSLDWEAISDMMSPLDVVQQAETRILNRDDGDIGHRQKFGGVTGRSRVRWGRTDKEDEVPPGVVKFADPDADSDGPVTRDPVERASCWARVQDRILSTGIVNVLSYQDDAAHTATAGARVPMCVISAGADAMVEYLVAHDHNSHLIGDLLDRDPDEVQAHAEATTTIT